MAILYTMVFVGCDAELTATVMSVLHVNGELANRRPACLALSGGGSCPARSNGEVIGDKGSCIAPLIPSELVRGPNGCGQRSSHHTPYRHGGLVVKASAS